MRKRSTIMLLGIVALVLGCTGTRTQPPTGQGLTASPPAGAQSREPAANPCQTLQSESVNEPGQWLADLLGRQLKRASITEAPETILQLGPCLTMEPVEGSGGKLLMVAYASNTPRYPVAAWYHAGAWRSAALPTLDESAGAPLARVYRETAAGAEVLAELRIPGTGQSGGLTLMRFGTELTTLWKSQVYDHFYVQLANETWVLARYRDPAVYDEPHAFSGNCCYPNNGQTLWKREGDKMVEKAARNHPSVVRTASAFAGAWNEGRLDLAAKWTSSSGVITAMSGGAAHPPAITLDAPAGHIWALEEAEAAHWEALPAELRSPRPSITEFVWPAAPWPLLLKRTGESWKVAGWK